MEDLRTGEQEAGSRVLKPVLPDGEGGNLRVESLSLLNEMVLI